MRLLILEVNMILLILLINFAYGADKFQLIEKSCKAHKIDCQVFKAVLAQESMFDHTAINHQTKDYGIGQINYRTARSMNMDLDRMVSDLEYSIDSAAQIFSWFQKTFAKREKYWYCRYNVGTGILVNGRLARCLKYVKLVEKHLNNSLIAEE